MYLDLSDEDFFSDPSDDTAPEQSEVDHRADPAPHAAAPEAQSAPEDAPMEYVRADGGRSRPGTTDPTKRPRTSATPQTERPSLQLRARSSRVQARALWKSEHLSSLRRKTTTLISSVTTPMVVLDCRRLPLSHLPSPHDHRGMERRSRSSPVSPLLLKSMVATPRSHRPRAERTGTRRTGTPRCLDLQRMMPTLMLGLRAPGLMRTSMIRRRTSTSRTPRRSGWP